jgi:hypothetical protein
MFFVLAMLFDHCRELLIVHISIMKCRAGNLLFAYHFIYGTINEKQKLRRKQECDHDMMREFVIASPLFALSLY